MKKTTVYHTRHCSYNLHVRLVFVTTYRWKVFTARIINELKTIFETVCLQFNAGLIEFDGEEDHVHLLILYPPKLSIADLVFKLKGTSSVYDNELAEANRRKEALKPHGDDLRREI